ncbi:MAG: DUF1800 domain-containing protein [Candidatus Obscuribacterales bacterium]|nr:DUF1800 domain-containing protein [Candidatus Obscuribacterales bacterium]
MKNSLTFLIALILVLPVGATTTVNPNEQNLHILNRLTFGPRPGDLESLKKIGVEAYLQQQLHPENLAEAESVVAFTRRSDAYRMTVPQLFQEYGPPAAKLARRKTMQTTIVYDRRSNNNSKKNFQDAIQNDVTEGKILRALASPKQLQEVMTDFWFNHFNVCANKGFDKIWIGSYEEGAIRPHALGKFRDLVEATCHHPAMLYYLDNWQNSAPGAKGSKGQFAGLNENYARELMELHTLGVDGGYTQKDVTELARVLTGLGLAKSDKSGFVGDTKTGCYFDATRHDFGVKHLLGHTINGSGEGEIEEALTILLRHPSTAHHICYQLAQYFISDVPPKALVDKLAAVFTSSDGDTKAVLNVLFHSPEFYQTANEENKFKSPFRYVISTLRAADARPGRYEFVNKFLKSQGMPLYECLTPDGYKNTRDAWCNPDTLLKRINFATSVATGEIPEVPLYAIEYRRLGATLGGIFSARTVKVIMKSPDQIRSALILGSPDFMKY